MAASNADGILPYTPLDTHIGYLEEECDYITKVIYYCDSRLRCALCILARETDPTIQAFLCERICKELVSSHMVLKGLY